MRPVRRLRCYRRTGLSVKLATGDRDMRRVLCFRIESMTGVPGDTIRDWHVPFIEASPGYGPDLELSSITLIAQVAVDGLVESF